MAIEKKTAGQHRATDGAVSARYTRKKPEDEKKKAAARPDKKPGVRPDKKTDKEEKKRPAAGAKDAGAAGQPAARRPARRASEEKAVSEKKAAEKKPAEKKPAGQKEKKAPARRAVMTDARGAERIRRKKERETGRQRREKKRIEAAMRDRMRAVRRGADMPVCLIVLLTALLVGGGLLLCALRTPGMVDMRALQLAALMTGMNLVTALVLPRHLPLDPLTMALTNFLCGTGVMILYTVSPERGLRQANFYVIGLAAMMTVSLVIARARRFKGMAALGMLAGVALLALPLAFGQWSGGAKNWVSVPLLGSFQPSELVKLSLVLAMAYYFSAHRTVLQMMPAILFAGACLVMLMLQRDLGTALIYYMTTLVMFYVACGNVPLTIIGMGGGAGAAVLGYKMFAHVKARVAMWRNPWSDPLDKGYQIIQALLAIGSGGLFGVGLGQGTPRQIPLYYNDFIFAVICEQLGLVFGVGLLLVYVMLIVRGAAVISRARRSFDMLLGCGVLAMLAIQTVMIVGGVIKMLPLTGVTMPFISYGGSSLLSCLCMVGMLHGIAARAQEDMEEDVLSAKG